MELRRVGDDLLYTTSLRPAGLAGVFRRGSIDERTEVVIDAGAVKPIDYTADDTLARPTRFTRYAFDEAAGRVLGRYKDKDVDLELKPYWQNRISAQLAAIIALRHGAPIPDYWVFDRGRWKRYRFEVLREQVVKAGKSTYDAVEVRYASEDKDRSWSMYCAPKLDYVPVLLTHSEGGKRKSRAELVSFERLGGPPAAVSE